MLRGFLADPIGADPISRSLTGDRRRELQAHLAAWTEFWRGGATGPDRQLHVLGDNHGEGKAISIHGP